MGLVSELQESLEYLRSKPDRPPVRSREVPASLARDIRRHVVQVIRSYPNSVGRRAVQRFEHPYRLPYEVHDCYAALLDVGIEDDETLRRLLLWFLDAEVLGLSDIDALTDSDQMILDLALASQRHSGGLQDYERVYALENHLRH